MPVYFTFRALGADGYLPFIKVIPQPFSADVEIISGIIGSEDVRFKPFFAGAFFLIGDLERFRVDSVKLKIRNRSQSKPPLSTQNLKFESYTENDETIISSA